MKVIIIGLGNFGSSLAKKLTASGNEVIGVDIKMAKIEALKEKVTHTVCLDSTDEQAVGTLPLVDADIVLICIGENEGANVMATALMKKLGVKRLISRAVTPLHQTVLEAMGVEEIIHPEEETADKWTKKLNFKSVIESFDLTGDYSIVEVNAPKWVVGKTILDVGFRKNFNLVILTTIKKEKQTNFLGVSTEKIRVQGVASSKTVIAENDILVFYGHIKDIRRFIAHGN